MRNAQITKIHELAIRAGALNVVRALGEKISVVNARDKFGNSFLMLAAKHGKQRMVDHLLEAGVPTDLRNNDGYSAADIAKQEGFQGIYRQLVESSPSKEVPEVINIKEEEKDYIDDAECGDSLGEWESDNPKTPPKHDPELALRLAEAVSLMSGHKPVDLSQSWDKSKIELPSVIQNDDQAEAYFPLTYALLQTCIATHQPLYRDEYQAAFEKDQISKDLQLPTFFWEQIPERLGIEIAANYSKEDTKNDVIIKSSPNLDDDVLFLVKDTLCQWRELNDLWIERFVSQFKLRDVLDREQEIRLAQRMDSALLAMHSVIHKPEHCDMVDALKHYFYIKEDNIESIDDSSNALDHHDTSDVGSSSNSFITFLTKKNHPKEEQAPPRPSTAEFAVIQEYLQRTNVHLLTELERHYNRFMSAKNQFFLSNLRLVYSLAKRYGRHHNCSIEDHVQNGCIGLLKAVEKFDYRLGFKFSTYSTWWVRQQIERELANQINTIRLPIHAFEANKKFKKTIKNHTRRISNSSTNSLKTITGLSTVEVEKQRELDHEYYSLERLSKLRPTELNYSEVSSMVDPFETVQEIQVRDFISKLLITLKIKEADVLRMRFGLEGFEEHTLEQVGQIMGVTRERIRQIESNALKQMRLPSRSNFILLEDRLIRSNAHETE